MATSAAPNQRASLLSGLRTGGVRSSSVNVPHTAAPGAFFNIPRFASASYNNNNNMYASEEDEDELADMVSHKLHFNAPPRMQQPPMTAAVDGSHNRFAQQQQGFHPGGNGNMQHQQAMNNSIQMHAQQQAQQQQALQMQMMQLEMLRLQTIQAQQYQADLLAQAQFQQQQQQQAARAYHNPPATAGPIATSFGAAQLRRPSQADLLRHQLGLAHDEQQVPMTAALNGKFGGRLQIPDDNNEFPGSRYPQVQSPQTPTAHTGVISGGAALGAAPSKSDAAGSWRRGPTNHSVLRRSPPPMMPDVKITPPPLDTDVSPSMYSNPRSARSPSPHTATPSRMRPSPLRFSPPAQAIAVIAAADESEDGSASEPSSGKSSPATPESATDFSPRDDGTGTKKQPYDGLGLGRPVPASAVADKLRAVSVPTRQPRGPPAGADELGPRNFAARIRRQAIGGLGELLERREGTPDAFTFAA